MFNIREEVKKKFGDLDLAIAEVLWPNSLPPRPYVALGFSST